MPQLSYYVNPKTENLLAASAPSASVLHVVVELCLEVADEGVQVLHPSSPEPIQGPEQTSQVIPLIRNRGSNNTVENQP